MSRQTKKRFFLLTHEVPVLPPNLIDWFEYEGNTAT